MELNRHHYDLNTETLRRLWERVYYDEIRLDNAGVTIEAWFHPQLFDIPLGIIIIKILWINIARSQSETYIYHLVAKAGHSETIQQTAEAIWQADREYIIKKAKDHTWN